MSKHVSFKKILSVAVAAALFVMPVAGCNRTNDSDTMNAFYSYVQNAEYPRIYALLTDAARQRVTLVDLSTRYQNVYSAVGASKIQCVQTGERSGGKDTRIVDYTMNCSADRLGDFSLPMEATLRLEGGKWLIDWTTELILPGLESGCRAVLNKISTERGDIFDAQGDALATGDHALSVFVDTGKVQNYDQLVSRLSPLLGMTEKDVRSRLGSAILKAPGQTQQPYDTVPPEAVGVSQTADVHATVAPATPSPSPTATPTTSATPPASPMYVIKAYPKDALSYDLRQKLLAIPGVGLDDTSMTAIRSYPYGDMLAQTLGYTGVISTEEQIKPENATLAKDAVVGKAGLEQSWEQSLRAQPGYELDILDANGVKKRTLALKTGQDGSDLRLTIDIKLQQTAEALLRQYLTPEMAGSVIVLDPKTGYVQAMASDPSFDPNLFSFPVDTDVLNAMLNDPLKPFINRPTIGRYPPGSTFKPFTAAMGLTDGVINVNSVFPYTITNNKWSPGSDWGFSDAITRVEGYDGAMNLENAITYSDNIYFAWTAMKIGGDKFYQHCLDLGLGLEDDSRMKFDIPLKASQITNSGKFNNPRLLADSGYGQGEFEITPLQMAALFGSLANSGDIMQPRIVKSVNSTHGPTYREDQSFAPTVWKKDVVSNKNLNILLPDLKRVAQIGTAKKLMSDGILADYGICAKTGTAEIGNDKKKEIAWLIAFTTQKMDRLVCVTIEVPAGEGDIRTEIARKMLEAEASPTGTQTPEESKSN